MPYTAPTLSHTDAQRIIAVIQADLEADGRGAAIAVTDAHGELIAFVRTDGCPLASINNAIHKAFTAARERIPSGELGAKAKAEGWSMANFADPRYIAWGGGVPVLIDGQVAGAVGVSGLPEADDIVLAHKGAQALTR
ncbi:MAG: heme-binding protein [bacterium]|nr:heme-binding protein [bacterium]